MMKKISVLVMGLVFSGAAFSQVAEGQFELTGNGGTVSINECGLLNEDVRINLTSGVEAAVDCSATRVAIATCHTAGRTVSRTQNVQVPLGCGIDGDDEDTLPDVECTGTEPQTVTGPAMAVATTTNGTVTSQYPGGDACSAAAALEYAGGL